MTPNLRRVEVAMGLWGDVTGLRGDVDECGLTDNDRVRGVDIETLVQP